MRSDSLNFMSHGRTRPALPLQCVHFPHPDRQLPIPSFSCSTRHGMIGWVPFKAWRGGNQLYRRNMISLSSNSRVTFSGM
jgi:hypothetical protein